MTDIHGESTPEQLQEFWQSVTENELAIGDLTSRMNAIQNDPSQRTQAGAEEWWRLFHQLKTYFENVEAAHAKLHLPSSR